MVEAAAGQYLQSFIKCEGCRPTKVGTPARVELAARGIPVFYPCRVDGNGRIDPVDFVAFPAEGRRRAQEYPEESRSFERSHSGPCVDGSGLSRDVSALQRWSVQ